MSAASAGKEGAETFTEVFRGMVEKSIEACGYNCSDIMVAKNYTKTGIWGESAQAYFYSNDSSIWELSKLSAIGNVLEQEVSDQPYFFTYLQFDKETSSFRSEMFFTKLADHVYDFIYECVRGSKDYIL